MNEIEIIRHERIRGLTVLIDTVSYRVVHEHPEWELIWVLENPLVVSFHADQYVMQPGEMVLICPDELHALGKQREKTTFLCLQIAPDILPVSRQHMLQERFPHRVMGREQMLELKRQTYSVACKYFDNNQTDGLYCLGQSMLVLHSLLEALPARELTAGEIAAIRKRTARIKRLLQFVDENYMHKIRLSDFAEREGCCLSHLSRLIKERTHQTFQEYVTYVRFLHACKMIDSGVTKMLDVCTEAGFSDYRYFVKAFRLHLGMTPEEYAQRSRHAAFRLPELRRYDSTSEDIYSASRSLAYLRARAQEGLL